jgi:hypothetical protein
VAPQLAKRLAEDLLALHSEVGASLERMPPKPSTEQLQRPRRTGTRNLGAVLLSLAGLSCDPFGTEHSFKDQGRICLYPSGSEAAQPFGWRKDPLQYEANAALDLVITMPGCLSSSCSHDERAACSVDVSGGIIRVESSASYRHQGSTCTADCGALAARCSTAPLPPGMYEIRHGQTTLAIIIPSTVTPPCAGEGLGS